MVFFEDTIHERVIIMERTYNKLVRDNIPDIIISKKETPVTRILNDEEYKKALEDKLYEEYEEVIETPIREVIDSQVDSVGIDAYIRPYELSNTPLPSAVISDEILDTTNFPEDPADVMKVGDSMIQHGHSTQTFNDSERRQDNSYQ